MSECVCVCVCVAEMREKWSKGDLWTFSSRVGRVPEVVGAKADRCPSTRKLSPRLAGWEACHQHA